MSATYRVSGMSCEGCARAVTRAIARRAPAASVSVDVAAGRVTVTGDAASAAVVDAVTEAGFTVEDVNGPGA
ncbi:MAG: cation transporter [Alphaproteobacteria bacterium]|nr:cation transporter [Alphaproteobacteria bacterium]